MPGRERSGRIIPEPGQTYAGARQQDYRRRKALGEVGEVPVNFRAPAAPVVELEPERRRQLADRQAELVHQCLASWLIKQRSPHTRRAYMQGWQAWCRWCIGVGESWLEPRHGLGAVWLAEQEAGGVSAATRRLRMAAVRGAIAELAVEGLSVGGDPFARCRQPKVPSVSATVPLLDDEVHRALEAAGGLGGRYRTLVLLLSVAALRSSEAAQVLSSSVRQSPWGLVCPVSLKGGDQVLVPLPPVLVEAAAVEGWPLDGWVGRHPAHRVAHMVRTVGAEAGIVGLHPHRFRHWHVTKALELGAELHHVQDSVNHASPVTTQRYNRQRNVLEHHTAFLIAEHVAG
jgi:integrase/recombinase XerD